MMVSREKEVGAGVVVKGTGGQLYLMTEEI